MSLKIYARFYLSRVIHISVVMQIGKCSREDCASPERIWPSRNLALRKFGLPEIWPSGNLAFRKFGLLVL